MAYATTAQFKTFGKIESVDATRDTFIDVLIARAEKIINKYCNVATFENSSTTSIFTEWWNFKEWLYLPVVQCETITTIKIYEMDSDRTLEDTFASDEYYIDKANARLKNLFGNIHNFEIEVVYTPNNGGVPVDIVQATIEIARVMWEDSNYGNALFNVSSKEVAEQTISIFDNVAIPKTAKIVLDQYKRMDL